MKKTMHLQNRDKGENLLPTILQHKHVVNEGVPVPLTQFRIIFFSVLSIAIAIASCAKQTINDSATEKQTAKNSTARLNTNANFSTWYDNIPASTGWELQQARAATAHYRNIENAKKDGYTNINVDVENMGHHYMKPGLVDNTFDIRHPEILVYHEGEDGKMELGAVEYAVPLASPRPEGFTGSLDVWDGNGTFNLWLLHAWVWSYNPDGVFNPLNPLVHMH